MNVDVDSDWAEPTTASDQGAGVLEFAGTSRRKLRRGD
ncbi:hypothetical protein MYSI104531_06675 [Mycobacterium simiae]